MSKTGLPTYKKPRLMDFVEELPKNVTRKIDKAEPNNIIGRSRNRIFRSDA